MRFLLPILTILISFQASAEDVWEHLGTPPAGSSFIDLKSPGSADAIRLLGAVNPPTLVMSGRPLTLEPGSAGPAGKGTGLWVNSVKQQVSGSEGRFFLKIEGASAAVPSLEVIMRTSEDKLLKGTVLLNRAFIEAPQKKRLVLPDSEVAKAKEFSFLFSGKIPTGSKLKSEEGTLKAIEDTIELDVKLPLGKHTLSTRLEQSDHSERIINTHLEVSKTAHDKRKAILSLKVPESSVPYEIWRLTSSQYKLEGKTAVGSKVSVNDVEVPVEKDGTFQTPLKLKTGTEKISIKVRTPEGKEEKFAKEIIVPDEEASPPEFESKFLLRRARAAFVAAFQLQHKGNTFSGCAGWNPSYLINKNFAIDGNADIYLLKDVIGGIFIAADLEALLIYTRNKEFHFGAGGGAQTWFCTDCGTAPIASLQGIWFPPSRYLFSWLPWVDRYVAEYSAVFVPSHLTHQFKLGAGVSF